MAVEFRLPKLGPEMETGLLTAWLVADGDVVEEGQELATVETDKVTTDIESPAAGAIALVAEAGGEYAVGAVLATIGEGATPQRAASASGAPAVTSDAPASGAPASDAPANDPLAPAGAVSAVDRAALAAARRGEPLATPVARRMAAAHGVALADVEGLADGGVIRKRHVEAAMQGRATGNGRPLATAPQPTAQAGTTPLTATRGPGPGSELTPMRRRIAQRMHASLQQTAQITDVREHEVSELIELRRAGVRMAQPLGFRVTFTDLFVRAAALSLRAVPALNASLTDDDRLIQHESINIGIAVAIPDGLIVPVLHGADQLSLAQTHARIDDLVTRARANRLTLEELSGGTFTVTNIGSYGSHIATPILVQGQVGIVGTGAFIQRAVVKDGELAIGTVMYTSLTIDHRVVDGRTSGEFQTAFGELIADPERLL